MPLGGQDTQYDLSYIEQDKIRRRIALKDRLKIEGVRKRYDPFLQMKGELLTDPAIDRYMDLRKKGRMPNTPFKPVLFFTLLGTIVIPILTIRYLIDLDRKPYVEGCASGEIPYKDRQNKLYGGPLYQ